jgi:predicted enzyme related to lactoylglutathione lyase
MPGPFVFFDLRTPDAAASRAFYTAFAELTVTDVDAGPATVPMFTDEGAPWGGLTELPAGDARTPQWVPYLPVGDLDAATRDAVTLGASVVRDRVDLPAGSVAVIADPGGATLALWHGRE